MIAKRFSLFSLEGPDEIPRDVFLACFYSTGPNPTWFGVWPPADFDIFFSEFWYFCETTRLMVLPLEMETLDPRRTRVAGWLPPVSTTLPTKVRELLRLPVFQYFLASVKFRISSIEDFSLF